MKKKFVLCGLMLQVSSGLFAAGDARSEINSLISTWLIPILGLCFIASFIVLVLTNSDGLRGKNGASKYEAWIAVAEGMIFVVVGIAALYFIVNRVSTMAFSI